MGAVEPLLTEWFGIVEGTPVDRLSHRTHSGVRKREQEVEETISLGQETPICSLSIGACQSKISTMWKIQLGPVPAWNPGTKGPLEPFSILKHFLSNDPNLLRLIVNT